MSRRQRNLSSDLTWAAVAFMGVFVATLWLTGRSDLEAEPLRFSEPAARPRQATAPPRALFEPIPDQHFRGCDEARAAGRVNIPSHDPSYRERMDGDGDGLACEPYW